MLFVPAKMKQRGWMAETALLVGLVAVAAAFRWPDLWTIPIFTDEGDEIGLALRIVRDGARPLTNDDPYLGPLFNYLLAGLFWLAGPLVIAGMTSMEVVDGDDVRHIIKLRNPLMLPPPEARQKAAAVHCCLLSESHRTHSSCDATRRDRLRSERRLSRRD